ncbi:ribonucleoside-diphosphate reductase large subunit-like [Prorops nasuta]|uniref:ribonucleoside-diphosphate reductase large subunit-like n=1 Tax=Prorops nasuta TaxID=863751 RepID=UPI0034D0122C
MTNTRNKIIANNGSIQNIQDIPNEIKALYKTASEIHKDVVIQIAVDRGAFIDQSQYVKAHISPPNIDDLSAMHISDWKKVEKYTLCDVCTRPAADPIQLTVDKSILINVLKESANETAISENGINNLLKKVARRKRFRSLD